MVSFDWQVSSPLLNDKDYSHYSHSSAADVRHV